LFVFSEFIMNPKVCLSVAVAACAVNAAEAIIPIVIGTAAVAGAVVLSPAIAAGLGAAIIGGGAIIKGLAIAGVAGGLGAGVGSGRFGRRGRRQAGEPTGLAADTSVPSEELAFAIVASTEPAQCYRRLICNIATGEMKPTELDVIPKFLTRKEVSVESPQFEFTNAALLGSSAKNIKACELRYSCPLTSQEIEKLF
jgi:hypothetical protein